MFTRSRLQKNVELRKRRRKRLQMPPQAQARTFRLLQQPKRMTETWLPPRRNPPLLTLQRLLLRSHDQSQNPGQESGGERMKQLNKTHDQHDTGQSVQTYMNHSASSLVLLLPPPSSATHHLLLSSWPHTARCSSQHLYILICLSSCCTDLCCH